MSEFFSFNSKIAECFLSKSDESKWYEITYHTGGNYESYAAMAKDGENIREYCSKLVFKIPQQEAFSKITEISLTLTRTKRDNYYGPNNVSAILCKKATTYSPYQLCKNAQNLSSNELENSLIGLFNDSYLAFSESGIAPNGDRTYHNWIFNIPEEKQEELQAGAEYCIFLKRKITLNQADKTNNRGFISFRNPEDSEELCLNFTAERFPDIESYYSNKDCSLDSRKINNTKYSFDFSILSQDQNKNLDPLAWSFIATDSNGNQANIEEMSLNVADDGRSAVFEYNTEGINYPFEGQVDIMVSWANGYYSLGSTINFPMKWRGLKSWLVGYAMKMITEPYPSKSPIFQYYGKHKILTLPPCEVFEGQNYVYLTVDILHQNSYVLYVCNLPLRYDEGQDIFVRAAIIEDYFGPLKIKVSRLSDETRWSEFEDFEYDKNSFFITPIWVSKNNLLYQEVGNKYYEPTLEYYEGGK